MRKIFASIPLNIAEDRDFLTLPGKKKYGSRQQFNKTGYLLLL